ncbi:hypothetical protein [Tsukamurella paurometabola]|uniref:Uncharacterized protein n=1 Tax=Tsukamurella paurometabola TaxID=2061 RepID=A0A3P8M9E5_TSUPA|nr:hypothetical protein [Tsukamurella paurometabola]UEA84425.1 hypothetical protein LK411_06275 [Tsukamurella paurometabola]VDR36990.1 Uncharacterised protein [Tsukamurella paurometabola]
MASDPTDLIREADEHHYLAECTNSDCAGCECAACGDDWPCEVRRLRDALDAMRTELAEMTLSRAELADEAQKLRNWRDGDARRERDEVSAAQADRDEALQQLAEVNFALAEANAAVRAEHAERARWQDQQLCTAVEAEAALAEANATIARFKHEVNMIAAHRTDWDDNGPEHDEWLASLGEKRLGGPNIAYRGIQYAVTRLRRAIEGPQS